MKKNKLASRILSASSAGFHRLGGYPEAKWKPSTRRTQRRWWGIANRNENKLHVAQWGAGGVSRSEMTTTMYHVAQSSGRFRVKRPCFDPGLCCSWSVRLLPFSVVLAYAVSMEIHTWIMNRCKYVLGNRWFRNNVDPNSHLGDRWLLPITYYVFFTTY